MKFLEATAGADRFSLLATGFISFILIGATQAIYGPAFPAFQARFSLSPATVGLLVSFHFIGSFAAILASGVLISRFGYKSVLTTASFILCAATAALALSPSWMLALMFALCIGLGFGLFDAGMNMLFTRVFKPNSAPALNLLNAMFGLGAVLGPLLIALFLPNVLYPFLILAGLSLVVFGFCQTLPNVDSEPQVTRQVQIPWFRFLGFVAIYLLYVASEVGAASWEATHLGPYYGEQKAALFTSFYWAALTLGRFVASPISAILRPATLVLVSVGLAFVAALFAHDVRLAPYAYAAIGFAFAPIFPTGLAWLQQVFPQRVEQLIPLIMGAANLGAVVSSPAIGWIISRQSSDVVPTVIAVTASLLFTISLLMWLGTRSLVKKR